MKRVCLYLSKYIIGILVVSAVIACSVRAQQPATEPAGEKAQDTKSSPQKPDAAKPDPDPTDTYVFPTNRQRFKRYVSDTVGPFRLVRTAAAAGISQWQDTPEEWGQGMKGYGRRFASGFGRNAIQQTVTYGLDEALDLDTGFRRSKHDGFMPRVKDAFLETVTSRTRSGKRVLSAPRLAGVYTSSIIATETWYPERYNYRDGLRIGSTTLLTNFGFNLVREFLINW